VKQVVRKWQQFQSAELVWQIDRWQSASASFRNGGFVAACFSAVAPLSSNSATGGQATSCCLAKTDGDDYHPDGTVKSSAVIAVKG
jgi:hypothetical protein